MGNQLAQEQAQLKNLNFSERELQKLYKNFSKIDRDKSGTLEPAEFFEIPGKWKVFLKSTLGLFWQVSTELVFNASPLLMNRTGQQPLGKKSDRCARP